MFIDTHTYTHTQNFCLEDKNNFCLFINLLWNLPPISYPKTHYGYIRSTGSILPHLVTFIVTKGMKR